MYTLKIGPEKVAAAITVLRQYLDERAALLVLDGDSCAITDAVTGVRMMDAIYRFKEDLQSVKTPAESAYDTLRFTVIPRLMDDEGIPSVTVAGVGRVNLQDDVQVKVLNQGELRDWLVENEFEDMIKPTVNAATLAAFIRRRMKEAADIPTSVDVKPIVRAVITRAGVE